ncbi:uncharacterized protein PV06_02144 [Exophiala oligosperma]|uniref:Zn(2)-C6 fungal-type domain-containing protein n=1 Tax=Exophiala oligosperma TaxID=215243 RepID=A0A0D2EEW9_9EURO|nr:uncharacterized protein PV06_02144 [Exophiala oligosperma]KIW46474.1 hypothetical protein PV06_02144 [Exophiala oligosperma]
MVYLGKPSRACAHCRRRKLRCDLRSQACGQCVRAGLVCGGYRDPNQLRIQDESQATRQKAMVGMVKALPPRVQIPLDEKAKGAFFSHYVIGMGRTYDVLERIDTQSSPDLHLTASVEAVSLAFFHFQYNSPKASSLAREKYLSALPLVNSALRSPQQLASDSTLLSILFLDLYEKIMHNDPRSSEAWMSHVRGALALFKFRTQQQFRTYVGRRLSVRLFTNMLISCVGAGAPAPVALLRLRQEVASHIDDSDPKWRVTGLVMEYTLLRAELDSKLLSNNEKIRLAKKLDHKFKVLADNLPASWVRHRISLDKQSTDVLEPYYDVYPDYFVAQTCNVIRIMRICLNESIRTIYTEMAGEGEDAEYNRSCGLFASQIIDAMAKEICAAGPQLTGGDNIVSKKDDFSPVRRLHCYTLLFPYYMAARYASPETNILPWVLNQLKSIASNPGIRHAERVGKLLESGEHLPPWSVYCILGSYAFAA